LSFAAVEGNWEVAYIIGILTLINSIFNCFVVYKHPAFQKGGPLDPSADPTAAYNRGVPVSDGLCAISKSAGDKNKRTLLFILYL
jgi:hypothetical protein